MKILRQPKELNFKQAVKVWKYAWGQMIQDELFDNDFHNEKFDVRVLEGDAVLITEIERKLYCLVSASYVIIRTDKYDDGSYMEVWNLPEIFNCFSEWGFIQFDRKKQFVNPFFSWVASVIQLFRIK